MVSKSPKVSSAANWRVSSSAAGWLWSDDEQCRSPRALANAGMAQVANALDQRGQQRTVIRSALPCRKALPRQVAVAVQAGGKIGKVARRGSGDEVLARLGDQLRVDRVRNRRQRGDRLRLVVARQVRSVRLGRTSTNRQSSGSRSGSPAAKQAHRRLCPARRSGRHARNHTCRRPTAGRGRR